MDKSQFIAGVTELYDSRLLAGRLTIEGNVCGCLLQDITYYDDCGLQSTDFITKHGRMLFTLGQKIRDRGFSNFDEITLISNINDELKDKVNAELGGWRQIQNVINTVSMKNWDAFLDALNKSNICLALSKKNFNLLEEMTLDNGKKVIPIKLFDKLTSSEVLDFYEGQLSSLETKINSSKIVEEGYIDFEPEFISSLENHEEMGVSFGDAGLNIKNETIKTFPFMSNQLLGLKHGTISAFAAHSGCGKSTYLVTILMSLISKGEKVLLVSNESQIADIKVQFLVWVLTRCLDYWQISKRKLISGNLSKEDKEKIVEARKWWKEHYNKSIKIVTLADADARLTCQIIKKHILRDGITTFAVDTMKITTTETNNDSVWMSLVKDVRELTEICLKYNTIGILTIQLALSTLSRSWLDSSCLSNSKAIKETLSNLVLFRKLNPAELDPNSPYFIRPFRRKQKEDGSWYDEPYTPDPTKVWKIFITDKCRRGSDSGDTGEAFLVRHDGDFCCFYETARCYPTHRSFMIDSK
jgi:energy-coupling factor transporter ATP-binding protein EcfA2